MTGRRILIVAVALAALASPAQASASCAPAPLLSQAIDNAGIVFVGAVVALDDDGRTAAFRVEDVWKGVVPATVVVYGGGEGFSEARTFKRGTRYLVFPRRDSGDVLNDDACSSTQPYAARLAAERPAEPRASGGGRFAANAGSRGSRWTWFLLGGLAGFAVAATVLAWPLLKGRRAARG